MSASTSASEDTQHPLVHILDDGNQLDEWLASYPPSRLGMPAALNNGAAPHHIWVLGVASIHQLAELAPAITAEPTFLKANDLMRDASAKVSRIQHDDDIPVRSQGKSPSKSKKQCRAEVQDAFHDQIILLAGDHPLWNQGRWTIIIKPSQIDDVFAKLAHSLASGELRRHASILGLRARTLPLDEGTFDMNRSGPKRPKTSRGRHSSGSSKSPGSSTATPAKLGIDVVFRPVWNSTAARDVLKVVAAVSGRMASFCKSSLYSRLQIKADHQLAPHTSLYSSKTLASPAEAKLWVKDHMPSSDDGMMDDASSQVDVAESSSKGRASASSPDTVLTAPDRPAETNKRQLEPAATLDAKTDEPAHKKARNGDTGADEKQSSATAAETPSTPPTKQSQAGVDESQDEPMLPVRPTSHIDPNAAQNRSPILPQQEPKWPVAATDSRMQKLIARTKPIKSPANPTHDAAEDLDEQSQTQVETTPAVDDPTVGKGSSPDIQGLAKEQTPSSAQKQASTSAQRGNAEDTASAADKEAKSVDQPEQQPAHKRQATPSPPADNSSGANRPVLMASESQTEIVSSFTPAFGDDVEKAAPPAQSEAEELKTAPVREPVPGLSDLVEDPAEPIALQQTTCDAKDKEQETSTVQDEASAKHEAPADPPVESGSSTVAADLGGKTPAVEKEEAASVVIEHKEASTTVMTSGQVDYKANSSTLESTVESTQEVIAPAQEEKAAATHGEASAQATEREKPADSEAPSTSATEQGEADDTGAGDDKAKSDEGKAQVAEPATTDTAKVDEAGEEAEMTFEELIREGAVMATPFDFESEDGAK